MLRMDKKLKYCCASCVFLNKENKTEEPNCYTYECLRTPRQHVVGWMHSDNELKTMGCSNWCKLKVGTKFRIKSRFDDNKKESWLYCGKVDGRYLIYKQDTKFFVYQLVSKDFFRGQTGAIKSIFEIIKQNETQFEASKRIAKERRKRYIGKNRNRN